MSKKAGLLIAFILLRLSASSAEPVRIGVLAYRGSQQCLDQWTPTADYLSARIPGHTFEIVPLDFEEIFTATEQQEIDFVLANPAIYTELSVRFNASRLATLNNLGADGRGHAVFGGTIFFRKSQYPAPNWNDLRKKNVAAVDPTSFGGWLTARREIENKGMIAGRHFDVKFLGTHDAVVYAVRDGRVDAGVARSDTLERMAAEGKISLDDFSVLACPGLDFCKEFPFLHSTRLYPEWPFAKTEKSSAALAQKAAVALMDMSPDHPAAAAAYCRGWTVPMGYQIVEDCLWELGVRPFEGYGKITFAEAVRQHWPRVASLLFLVVLLLSLLLVLSILNRKMTQARKVAEQAVQAKSAFLANMSHEIRTPMNAVIGMTDLLMETELSSEQKEFANIIRVSGESLLSLISDVLDYSKIEAGRMALEQQDFDLAGCVEDALDLIVSKTTEKGIELTYEIESNVPAVIRGDSGRLRQILLNLLSNAAKFTFAGEIHVAVSAKQRDADFEILFAVRDTGIGIDQKQIDHIFDAFTQADNSTTRTYGGTGLGLSISRRLSELMGGRMWAESRPGSGSTFHFTIHAQATNRNKTIFSEQRAFETNMRDVLIVDDNETNLKILSAQLTRWGLRPVRFDTPRAALESILAGDEYALVITDMQMPEMDGVMLTREIRKHRTPAQLPIIMLTSIGLDKPDKALQIDSYLNKPVKPAQLHQNIAGLLHGEGGDDAVADGNALAPFAAGALRLLVVEDNRVNQTVALRMLKKLGCSADLAGDGREALEMAQQKEYDLILMDIQMPRMDGLTATKELIELFGDGKRPRIIGMTAHAANEERERGLAAGMDDYLTKPIQLVKLKEVLWSVQDSPSV